MLAARIFTRVLSICAQDASKVFTAREIGGQTAQAIVGAKSPAGVEHSREKACLRRVGSFRRYLHEGIRVWPGQPLKRRNPDRSCLIPFAPNSIGPPPLSGGTLLALSVCNTFAGVEATADKEIAQQAAVSEPFPLHFALSFGGDDEFVFRGVDILPEVDIKTSKVLSEAINMTPGFPQYLAAGKLLPYLTPQAFGQAASNKTAEISREDGLYYFDSNVSGYGFTLGAFYGTQSGDRPEHTSLGAKPLFDAYHEFDAYLNYSRSFGPVRVTLGGTFYHVINNSDFDTAELNFGVSYTPPQFSYVTASFSYDYAGAFNFSDYHNGTINGQYLDGHYLELRLDGRVPVYKHVVTFDPYVLVSAGSGIIPRAFNPLNLPTYFNTERLASGFTPYTKALYQSLLNGTALPTTGNAATPAAFDPSTLDRSFDLSNFQAGFRIPFHLTRYITLRADFNYSRPLGNLDREPYNQKDQVWGGGTVTLSF